MAVHMQYITNLCHFVLNKFLTHQFSTEMRPSVQLLFSGRSDQLDNQRRDCFTCAGPGAVEAVSVLAIW